MEDGARLAALSLLMKGETLPAGTAWAGSPASWQGEAQAWARRGLRARAAAHERPEIVPAMG
jgi:hypothetical protein